jgi:hypothetical protein
MGQKTPRLFLKYDLKLNLKPDDNIIETIYVNSTNCGVRAIAKSLRAIESSKGIDIIYRRALHELSFSTANEKVRGIKISAVRAEAKIVRPWCQESVAESDLRASPRHHRVWPRTRASKQSRFFLT